MNITVDFFGIIDILSIATCLVLGFIFSTIPSKNRRANVFLALFLWSLGLEVVQSFIESQEGVFEFPFINNSVVTIPFLLLYVLQTINKSITWKHWLLFLPLILVNIPVFEGFVIYVLEYVFNIGILVYILNVLRKHKQLVNNYYSDIQSKTLQWIKIIVFIFLLFHAFWIVEDIVSSETNNLNFYFAQISLVLTFTMIYWIAYNGFSQSEIFKDALFLPQFEEETNEPTIEAKEEDTKANYDSLINQITKDKLYTNANLNLRELAKQVNIKEKELSKLINTHAKTNFYQFINGFRVSEFKKLLNSPKSKQLSILGLAEEAGFSSKSTFYTAFKASEGMTPKQFQERQ